MSAFGRRSDEIDVAGCFEHRPPPFSIHQNTTYRRGFLVLISVSLDVCVDSSAHVVLCICLEAGTPDCTSAQPSTAHKTRQRVHWESCCECDNVRLSMSLTYPFALFTLCYEYAER